MKCKVCGNELPKPKRGQQKTYHEPCKRWRNYLDAAVRAAQEMDPKPTREGATVIRQETFTAANRMAAIAQPRDELGRFC